MNMSQDPIHPPTAIPAPDEQWDRKTVLIVLLCFMLNMVDGMDVNIMSFVRSALSKDWGVADKVMGYVMSAGTFGMVLGTTWSLQLGG